MSQFFASGGQSVGVSASASVFPKNIRLISFRMDWLDLLAVHSKGYQLWDFFGGNDAKAESTRVSALASLLPKNTQD